jgi:hypothetical protein
MTAVEYIKKRIEEDSDTSFSNIDWDKFDEIIEKAIEIEKSEELKEWIGAWSFGYNRGWDNCIKKFKQQEQ